jgi:hypothetical protein
LLIILFEHGFSLLGKCDVWGHRKDIDEYYEIKPEVTERIKELKSEGMADLDILDRMVRDTRLSRDLLEFLMKGK